MTKKNKKGHAGLIIFILILILAIGGGTGFYFYQRQQPRKAVEQFLDSMKNMDFTTMESMIQSSDLSALDNAGFATEASLKSAPDPGTHWDPATFPGVLLTAPHF